jgi:quinol-cytochrome oxidoreductase complex cytochrome b subunit
MEEKNKTTDDPRYAPPYPQEFHNYWPKHVIKAGVLLLIVVAAIILLAYQYQLPMDINMPPMPNDGAYIPSPDWYLLFFYQPFWYFTGDMAYLRPIGTVILPLLFLLFLLLVPFIFGRKKDPSQRMTTVKKVFLCLSVWLFAIFMGIGLFGSGYPAKVQGCRSCHNPMMGVRQAEPPADIAEYFRVERQRQIEVGRYRAGKTFGGEGQMAIGGVQSYKDANWQLRHFYEPQMTW